MPAIIVDIKRGIDATMGGDSFSIAKRAPILPPGYLAEDNRSNIFGIEGAFLFLGLIAVCLRMYVRVKMVKVVGADDWVMVAAAVFSVAIIICSILQGQYGLGRHIAAWTPEDFVGYWHIQFYSSLLWVAGMNLVKISITLLLIRLASLNKYRKFLWGIIVFLIMFTISCCGSLIFMCIPVSGSWDPVVKATAHCYSMKTFKNLALFNTVVNVTTDILLATIPLPLIWKLQVNKRTKVSLGFILSLGYFVCAAGIIMGHRQANYLNDIEGTFTNDINLWGYIQLQVGIIAACAPTLKPLFRVVLEYSRAMASGNNNRSGKNSNGENNNSSGVLSFLKSKSQKSSKSRRTTSVQLSSIADKGNDTIHSHPTNNHGYDVRVEIETKYGADNSSANASSLDPIDNASAKTSQENILPNNINQWPINQRNTTAANSRHSKKTTITKTTEVIVRSTANPAPNSPVGKPESGKF